MSPTPDSNQKHLASLTLSALALGSLSTDERTAAESHLAGCDRCRAFQSEMQADRERFAQGVFARTLPQIRERASARWWSPASWVPGGKSPLGWLVPAGALAVALAVVVLSSGRPTRLDGRERFGVKGGPTLQVFAKRGIEVFAVHDGATLKPGDQLRFAVEPGDFGHLLIASLDGAGHATVYYPFGGEESGTVTPESRSELPGSVTLDATSGDERLFALFSKEALPAREVLEKLEREKPKERLSIEAGAQVALEFHKAAP